MYSLGVVLYELLAGGVPYEGETFVTVALKHVNEPLPSVLDRRPDVPPRVAMAVERAMAKSPDDRFASMNEFVDELQACLAEVDPAGEQATMIQRRPAAREASPATSAAGSGGWAVSSGRSPRCWPCSPSLHWRRLAR